jgi:hypothetical protein
VEITKTERGFRIGKFTDLYGIKYSIQESSLATDDAIWFGTDDPKLVIFEDENMGKYIETTLPKNWSVHSRMHLNREQVAELIPILQKFVDTGELE